MVAAIGAVAGVAGAAISASSAGDAADAQSAAAQQSSQAQMMANAQMRQDLAPWTEAGGAAQTALNQRLGIGGVGNSGVTSMGLATGLSPDQVRQQLLSRYTSQRGAQSADARDPSSIRSPIARARYTALARQGATPEVLNSFLDQYASGRFNAAPNDGDSYTVWDFDPSSVQSGSTSTVDEEGLNAAIQQYYAEQQAQNAAAASDPNYGSLLRDFRNGEEFDPGPAFSFTGKDLENEPGYQFGLNQGTQGIERGQAARGNFLSGAAMKELNRFNQDYAGTKFDNAFNRASSTYGTNLGARERAWNTNLGSYNANRDRVYNFLTGVSSLGQNSAARVGTNNQQVANNVGNNMLASGAAQSAGAVASGNAWQSGLNTAANNLRQPTGINSVGGWNNLLAQNSASSGWGGSNNTGFGTGSMYGNQDYGMNF